MLLTEVGWRASLEESKLVPDRQDSGHVSFAFYLKHVPYGES